jgi:hypothetical protein
MCGTCVHWPNTLTQADALHYPHALTALAPGCSFVGIDINGNRAAETVATVVESVERILDPQVLVVKSSQLYDLAQPHLGCKPHNFLSSKMMTAAQHPCEYRLSGKEPSHGGQHGEYHQQPNSKTQDQQQQQVQQHRGCDGEHQFTEPSSTDPRPSGDSSSGIAILANQGGFVASVAAVASVVLTCGHCLKILVWKPKFSQAWHRAKYCSTVCKDAAVATAGANLNPRVGSRGRPSGSAIIDDVGVLQSNSKVRKSVTLDSK